MTALCRVDLPVYPSEQSSDNAGKAGQSPAFLAKDILQLRAPIAVAQRGSGEDTYGSKKGQAAIEFALLYSAVILPLTFILIFVSQMLWSWHTVVDYTRNIAQFAATHCWMPDASGSNVLNWATSHVPPMMDQDQFISNAVGITVNYYTQNPDGTQTPFDGGICNGGVCMPDLVSVGIHTYTVAHLSSFFGLPNVTMPPFTTVVPMQSGGYQDATGTCVADATQ